MFYHPGLPDCASAERKDSDAPLDHPATSWAFISLVALGLVQGCSMADKSHKTVTPGTEQPQPAYGAPVSEYGAVAPTVSYQAGGTVVDATSSQPVVGVVVSFMGATATSSATGEWTIQTTGNDCRLATNCIVTATPQSGSGYTAVTKQLASSKDSATAFVSLGNVIKIAKADPVPAYGVAVPVYGAQAP